jgi:hypothetical protein
MNRISQVFEWLKRNRQIAQQVALGVAILSPFGLYYAMQSGQSALASMCFALLAAALALTILAY